MSINNENLKFRISEKNCIKSDSIKDVFCIIVRLLKGYFQCTKYFICPLFLHELLHECSVAWRWLVCWTGLIFPVFLSTGVYTFSVEFKSVMLVGRLSTVTQYWAAVKNFPSTNILMSVVQERLDTRKDMFVAHVW